ncbi:hypothetical protein FQN55_009204 [Onygenales sp. PD_40]|nr:hypothetical protein FQN55_009204 [Onygenales sp. PD_40]
MLSSDKFVLEVGPGQEGFTWMKVVPYGAVMGTELVKPESCHKMRIPNKSAMTGPMPSCGFRLLGQPSPVPDIPGFQASEREGIVFGHES